MISGVNVTNQSYQSIVKTSLPVESARLNLMSDP